MSEKDTKSAIGRHWDKKTVAPNPSRMSWWQSPRIIAHVNRIVCGESVDGFNQGALNLLRSLSGDRYFEKALSIGCGSAAKELKLVKQGIVGSFDLFELSSQRCKQAVQHFDAAGFGDRINIVNKDFFEENITARYDLIHWDNSLHHMMDCPDAVARTYESLRPGGYFYMNDFVGATRFQWSDEELAYVNHFRNSLPDEFFVNPNGGTFRREVRRPALERMMADDPSEAADSASIIPALKKYLNDPVIVPTGGTIYHSGLNGILANIAEDSPLLAHALMIDSSLISKGIYQYAVCLSGK